VANGEVTLYAVWNENDKVLPVIFSQPTAVDYGDSVTLSCGTEGATIYYTTDTVMRKYTAPIEITKDVKIVAYATKDGLESSDYSSADYTVKTYTVTYTTEYGVAPSKIDGLKKGDKLTAEQLPVLTTAGYTFYGWYNGENEVTTEYKISSDVELTAKWTANTYTVQFNANVSDNSVTGTMADMSFNYNEEKALTKNTFTRKDYTFAGWATTTSGGVTYTDEQEVSNLTAEDKATFTLYAVWEKTPTYSGGIEIEGNKGVTFWLNGNASNATITLSKSQSVTISVKSGDTPLALTNAPTITVYNHGDVASPTQSLTQNTNGTYSFTIPNTFPKDETYQFVVSCDYENITYTDTFTVKLSQ
jgi:uncharacterized repeat protein (TIGR02543 family)